MYRYDEIDQRLVDERVAQYRDQTRRYLDGQLDEEAFKALRLRNGLYIQRHGPMLRVAIPYGLLSSNQLRRLAAIARRYDRGLGHFTTRQNIQFNWIRLAEAPEVLAELAEVQMHAIQTSGNCVRNVTCDHFAGVAPDEVVDPLVWCELIRQWSTFHPEFSYLPRKFKIAVSGSPADRAATLVHDIGLVASRGADGEPVFRVSVGGGLGRTPIVGHVIREALPWRDLLGYLEAVLRVYNRLGRRDNIHKARIKILVKDLGPEAFARAVEAEWAAIAGGALTLVPEEIERVAARFVRPAYERFDGDAVAAARATLARSLGAIPAFAAWHRRNVHPHKQPGYAAVTLSLKKTGTPPGDVSADQMETIAGLAERYSHGMLRVTHEQNLVLADVRQDALVALWSEARAAGLATPNVGLITNVIACPGGDYCGLANARSIPVAEAIQRRFDDLDHVFDIGELDLNISGCINACAHHHVGHIGILGVDKNGAEFYQLEIGGRQGAQAALGQVLGPAFAADEIADAVERLIAVYLERRDSEFERFIDVVHRIGVEPFKERVYGAAGRTRPDRPRALAAA